MSTIDWTTPEGTQENWSEMIEVNGEQLSIEELKKGYMRQSDYTRKTQELKREQQEQLDPDWEQAIARLNANGYVRRDEIENIKQSLTAEQRFAELISANPELKKQEKAIKEIAQLKGIAYEDVIEEYWFGSIDKLNKAKDRRLVWDRQLVEEKQKSISELSPGLEREEWKRANSNASNMFTKSRSF